MGTCGNVARVRASDACVRMPAAHMHGDGLLEKKWNLVWGGGLEPGKIVRGGASLGARTAQGEPSKSPDGYGIGGGGAWRPAVPSQVDSA